MTEENCREEMEKHLLENYTKVKMKNMGKAYISNEGTVFYVGFSVGKLNPTELGYSIREVKGLTGSDLPMMIRDVMDLDTVSVSVVASKEEDPRRINSSLFTVWIDVISKLLIQNEEFGRWGHKLYSDITEALKDEISSGRHLVKQKEYAKKSAMADFRAAVKSCLKAGVDTSSLNKYIENQMVQTVMED